MTEVAGVEPAEAVVIEVSVLVYLEWDRATKRWSVAPCTVDGHALDTTESGLSTDCGPYSMLDPEDQQVWDLAAAAPLPTAVEVAHMILDLQ